MIKISRGVRVCFWLLLVATTIVPLDALLGCPKCFGSQADSPITQGISMAMMGMVGITGTVLGSIVAFFIYMKRRADKLRSGKYVVSDQGVLLPLPERLLTEEETRS